MRSALRGVPRRDVVIAAIATVVGAVDMVLLQVAVTQRPVASVLSAVVFLGVTVPLLWRSVAPNGALVAALASLGVHALLFPSVVRCGIVYPVALLLVFASGARLGRGRAVLGLGLALALTALVSVTDGPSGADLGAMSFVGPVTVAIWAIGRLVHSRARMTEELEVRTGELQEARDERARLEVTTERARLASELDELLQRRLGALAQLADDGSQVRDAATSTATLAEIERESRRTLDEMRTVVRALRPGQNGAPMAPQATVTHLEALVLSARGGAARLEVEGLPRALPADVELSAHRTAEHLLEAVRDAQDVEVRVRFGDQALELTVAAPIRRQGQEAIERARERVRRHHGRLEATTRDGRAEATVSLPIYATA